MSTTEEGSTLPQRTAKAQTVTFYEDRLVAVVLDGEGVAVPVREICHTLGLDLDAQSERLREHEVLARGLRVVRIRVGDRMRPIVAILHKYIPFWLATISPNMVADDVRPKLVRYQIELVDVLAAIYGMEQQPLTPATTDSLTAVVHTRLSEALAEVRLAREAYLAAQQQLQEHVTRHEQMDQRVEDHEGRLLAVEGLVDDLQAQMAGHTTITAAQQEVIKRAIQQLSNRYKKRTGEEVFGLLFYHFCKDLGTPKYALLRADRYNDALDWLRRKAQEYLPDDPDALPPLQESLL